MENWLISEDLDVLKQVSEDNIIASLAISDLIEENQCSFIVSRTYINKKDKHKMATFLSITDPDWEEEIDLTEIEQDNEFMFPVEVGGLFQVVLNSEEKHSFSIYDTDFNSSQWDRFENIADYISFYAELDGHKQTEDDFTEIISGMIQGAYCLCQICSEMEFENSPITKNGKTKMKNLIDGNIKDIKKAMFTEKHEANFFYDLTIKTLDCMENVGNYFSGEKEKFVDATNVKTDDKQIKKDIERTM